MSNVIVTNSRDLVVVTGEEKFNVITEGIQGPPGASGVGGYDADIISPQVGDLLSFSSNKWINIRRVDVSDGGNF